MKVEYYHAYCVFEDVKWLILGVTFLVKQRVRVNTCTNLCRNGIAYWYDIIR